MRAMPRGGGPLVGCRDGTQISASRRPRSASNNRKRLPSVALPRWRSRVLCVAALWVAAQIFVSASGFLWDPGYLRRSYLSCHLASAKLHPSCSEDLHTQDSTSPMRESDRGQSLAIVQRRSGMTRSRDLRAITAPPRRQRPRGIARVLSREQ